MLYYLSTSLHYTENNDLGEKKGQLIGFFFLFSSLLFNKKLVLFIVSTVLVRMKYQCIYELQSTNYLILLYTS